VSAEARVGRRRVPTVWRYTGLVALGAALGLLGARYVFVGSGVSLVPWGLVALLVGAFAPSRRAALAGASAFGFALAFTFMVTGYDGTASVLSTLPFFALLGTVGAACAALLALTGHFVATATQHQH
jgi:hypothetical protein